MTKGERRETRDKGQKTKDERQKMEDEDKDEDVDEDEGETTIQTVDNHDPGTNLWPTVT